MRTPRLAALTLVVAALSACGTAQAPGTSGTSGSPTGGTAAAAPTGSGSTGSAASADCPPTDGTTERKTEFSAPPPMCIDPAKKYTATVTTDVGAFTIDLLADKAPQTVNNFVFLARNKYYDGIVFHRVIPGFMNQTGDPQGTGQGGPGYEFADELPAPGEYKVGSVAMANAGPNTNGSQFFVVTGDAGVGLPPDYSLFGTVTKGMEVVHAIEKDGSPSGAPTKQHVMKTVTISEK